eukprot:symbB.v1.2.024549.t1/scaffold2329.1/size82184/3
MLQVSAVRLREVACQPIQQDAGTMTFWHSRPRGSGGNWNATGLPEDRIRFELAPRNQRKLSWPVSLLSRSPRCQTWQRTLSSSSMCDM